VRLLVYGCNPERSAPPWTSGLAAQPAFFASARFWASAWRAFSTAALRFSRTAGSVIGLRERFAGVESVLGGRPRLRPFALTVFLDPGGRPRRFPVEEGAITLVDFLPRRGARDPASSSSRWVGHRSLTRFLPPIRKVTDSTAGLPHTSPTRISCSPMPTSFPSLAVWTLNMPSTSRLAGGDDRTRTGDPLLAKQTGLSDGLTSVSAGRRRATDVQLGGQSGPPVHHRARCRVAFEGRRGGQPGNSCARPAQASPRPPRSHIPLASVRTPVGALSRVRGSYPPPSRGRASAPTGPAGRL